MKIIELVLLGGLGFGAYLILKESGGSGFGGSLPNVWNDPSSFGGYRAGVVPVIPGQTIIESLFVPGMVRS